MSALSLHHWLELEGAATPRYAAIIEAAAGALAVLVDGIENVMEPKADDLAAMLSQDTRRARRGLTRDLVTLLDPELLLQSPELWVDQRRGRGLAAGEQVP
jgi:chemotaxis signal transduction protein